jgi:hypothetical protein
MELKQTFLVVDEVCAFEFIIFTVSSTNLPVLQDRYECHRVKG